MSKDGELHGAAWMYVAYPFAIKVAYIKAGVLLYTPGWPWHPDKPSKVVKLSPYDGGTEPIPGTGVVKP